MWLQSHSMYTTMFSVLSCLKWQNGNMCASLCTSSPTCHSQFSQTEAFVLVGSWGGGGWGQWHVFCCFSRELRPTMRLIFPSMNGVRATAGFTQKCKNYSCARFCKSSVGICSRFILITLREPLTHPWQWVPRGSYIFHNRVAWSNEGNASKVKAIWRAHPARLHVQLSRLWLLAIRKAHGRLSGADPRSVSTVRQWHVFVELWMRYL